MSASSTARRGRSPKLLGVDTAEAFPAGGDGYQHVGSGRRFGVCRRERGGVRLEFARGGGSGLSEVDAASRRAPPFARSARRRTRVPRKCLRASPSGDPSAMRHYGTSPPLRSSEVQRSACRRDHLSARCSEVLCATWWGRQGVAERRRPARRLWGPLTRSSGGIIQLHSWELQRLARSGSRLGLGLSTAPRMAHLPRQ